MITSLNHIVRCVLRWSGTAVDMLPLAKSLDHPYPACGQPTDVFHLPTVNTSLPLSFVYCRPQKFTRRTLGPSGSMLGLAPSKHLKQTKSTPLISQLLKEHIIERPLFSLMLINGHDGVLSIGGTGAAAVDLVVQQTKDELDRVGALERGEVPLIPTKDLSVTPNNGKFLARRSRAHMEDLNSRQAKWDDDWAWSHVQGAEGWWQMLMQGVWVDGSRVLQNHAVVADVGYNSTVMFSLNFNTEGTNQSPDQQSIHSCSATCS